MRKIPELKQSTVNFVVIIGVIIIAAGAWTMPLYQAQLAHDDALDIIDDIAKVQADADDLQADISGDGLTGKQDLVALMTAGANEDTLQQLMGDDFNEFQNEFFKLDPKASQFQNIEVKTFIPVKPRFKLPFDLLGFQVTESAGAPGDVACNTAGTLFDAVPPGPVTPLSLTGPASIDGWALMAPDTKLVRKVQLEICIDGANQPTIIDEIVDIGGNHTFTKNFEYGVLVNATNIRVVINDSSNSGENYKLWMFTSNPVVEEIRSINDIGGGIAGFGKCGSITVNVKNAAGANQDNVNVNLEHSFLPLFKSEFTGPPNAAGNVVFNPDDFGGIMPAGQYFIDVFPPFGLAGAFPVFEDEDCIPNENAVVNVVLVTGAQFAAQGGAQQGNLVVNIKNQFGTPIANTRAFVDAVFAPLFNDVCENGGVAACFDGIVDNVPIGTLVDPTADGTFTINNLPLPPAVTSGTYQVNICGQPPISCAFVPATLFPGQTTTIEVTLFDPAA